MICSRGHEIPISCRVSSADNLGEEGVTTSRNGGHAMLEPQTNARDAQQSALCEDMLARHGPLLSGPELVRALGFRNAAALRQARHRGHLAVRVFSLPNRKGPFAMTSDVADWLYEAVARNRREANM